MLKSIQGALHDQKTGEHKLGSTVEKVEPNTSLEPQDKPMDPTSAAYCADLLWRVVDGVCALIDVKGVVAALIASVCQKVAQFSDDSETQEGKVSTPQHVMPSFAPASIGGNGELDLRDALLYFAREEKLASDEGDGILCELCSGHGDDRIKRDAVKRVAICRTPHILTLHLKRFKTSLRGFGAKVDRKVTTPLSLDISGICTRAAVESGVSASYTLKCIVSHSGSLSFGHYIAFVRRGQDWYHVSDASVREVNAATALNSQAFLLFYERYEELQ